MDHDPLADLTRALDGLSFPADKDEVLEHLAAAGVPALAGLVEALPGRWFLFASDLLSTARIALDMHLGEPWPATLDPPEGGGDDAAVAAEVGRRLRRCRGTNGRLVRVTVERDTIYLDGRAADVPQGVMATRVCRGVRPAARIVNRLEIGS